MVPKKQIGKTLDFTKVLWASSQCAIWNRINIARGIPSTELFHILESLLRNYNLIMNTAILMLPGTQICQLVNTGNKHIYYFFFFSFYLLKNLSWKKKCLFVSLSIFFNQKFIIKMFSALYLPIYTLTLLALNSVSIKSFAVKHLETSAVKFK